LFNLDCDLDTASQPVPRKSRAEIGEQRRARMRRRLMEAGARAIATHGLARATIDDFIAEARVSRGTFYNHFSMREDLLEALWEKAGRDPFREIHRACAGIADPAERLAAVTRSVLHRCVEDPTLGWLIVAMSADRRTVNEDLRTYPRPDLALGREAGRFVFDDLASASDLVVGTVRTGLRALLSDTRAPGYVESLCRLILSALGMDRAEAGRISRLPLDPATQEVG
jgi:AcrR family transcriptional regulator